MKIGSIIIPLAVAVTVSAGTVIWNGPRAEVDWYAAANWKDGVAPTAEDVVVFPDKFGPGFAAVIGSGNVTIKSLAMNGGMIFANFGSLTVSGDVIQKGNSALQTRAGNDSRIQINGNYQARGGMLRMLQDNPGGVVVKGNLTAANSFTFCFNLNQSKQFGSVRVEGALQLNSAKLQLERYEEAVAAAEKLILIRSVSGQETSGTFSNAAFGTAYNVNGKRYTLQMIDFDGDGVKNDIALVKEK